MSQASLLAIVFAGGALSALWIALGLDGRRDPVAERLKELARARDGKPLTTEFLPEPTEPQAERVGLLRRLRQGAFLAIDRMLAGRGFTGQTARALKQADLKLRVSEWAAARWAAAFAGVVAGLGVGGVLVGLLGLAAGVWLPVLYLRHRAHRRRKAFDAQLPDALALISNALKSGHALLQALEVAASELPAPAADEFGQVLRETRVGISTEDALANLVQRMPSDDLDLIVTAVLIQRQVGGNLAEVLDKINATIRDRIRILGQIRTLTSQGRLSGWIVAALPVCVGLLIYVMNPTYLQPLFGEPIGWAIIGAGAVLQVIGMTVISSIVNFEV